MEEKLNMRSEVKVEETWDLSAIYKTEADMERDLEKALALGEHIVDTYRGKLTDADTINACLEEYRTFVEITGLVGEYNGLAVSVDYYDTHNQEREERVSSLLTEAESELSFIDSEIVAQEDAVIEEAIEKASACKLYLREILRGKPHLLTPETERVLTAYSQVLNDLPYNIYNTAKLMDMVFPSFTVDGETFPLGYSLFEDNYEYERRTSVRHAAFKAFSEKLRQYENVTAAAYNAEVKRSRITAQVRGFASVFDYLLFEQKVTREMYDRQIDLITEKLAPHMRRYAKLIQSLYGLEKMTFADLKLPLDADYDPKVTIDGSREYIEKGLACLGEEYIDMVREAYRDRWVDFARNQGKETGGFCSSPYGSHSFILLSWNGRMSDVFTLAHELGHAGHFKMANEAQSVFDTDVSSYMVEAPSTCNELIMGHYLLSTSDDPRFRRWVLSCIVSNTYYHNFVTHLLEGAYQREVLRIIDDGGSVNAETLSGIERNVLEKFWGDAVEITEGAELTWMRQPHYYMGLYSYTYSAGLTVATQAMKRIEREGAPAVADWKRMLRAGSTADPVGLAAIAGIDITTSDALLDTIETIGGMIDEIEKLTDIIGDRKN